jgi:hypothetical protein
MYVPDFDTAYFNRWQTVIKETVAFLHVALLGTIIDYLIDEFQRPLAASIKEHDFWNRKVPSSEASTQKVGLHSNTEIFRPSEHTQTGKRGLLARFSWTCSRPRPKGSLRAM